NSRPRPIFPNDRFRQGLSRKRSTHQTPFALQVLPFRAIHLKMTLLFRAFRPFALRVQSARGFHIPTNWRVGGEGLQSAKRFVDCPIRHYETPLRQKPLPFFFEVPDCPHTSEMERSLDNPK